MTVGHNSIKAYRKVRVYYHRAHVNYVFNRSTYVYNTVKAFFNKIYSQVKEKGEWQGWSFYMARGKKGRVYVLVNPRLGLELRTQPQEWRR